MYVCPITERSLDPMQCIRRLNLKSKGEVNRWIDERAAGVSVYENEELIVDLVRNVFGMPEWDTEMHTGYTDEQVLRSLATFNEFISKNV